VGFFTTKVDVQNKQHGGKIRVVFSHSKFSHALLLLNTFKLASSLNFVGWYLLRQRRKVSNLN